VCEREREREVLGFSYAGFEQKTARISYVIQVCFILGKFELDFRRLGTEVYMGFDY
jgi:hypothetical protein